MHSSDYIGNYLAQLYPWYYWIVKESKEAHDYQKFPETGNYFTTLTGNQYHTVIWYNVLTPTMNCTALQSADRKRFKNAFVPKVDWFLPYNNEDDLYFPEESLVQMNHCHFPLNVNKNVRAIGFNDIYGSTQGEFNCHILVKKMVLDE